MTRMRSKARWRICAHNLLHHLIKQSVMTAYKYVGRKTPFKGKPLWEIIGNLKNYGVGRLIFRNQFQRYDEVCFYKILKAAAWPNPVYQIRPEFVNFLFPRRCIVLVEEYFRGVKNNEIVQLYHETYKDDFHLIPKDEEYKYFERVKPREERILPKTMELPPLMKIVMERQFKAKGVDGPLDMEVVYNFTRAGTKPYRIAKDGETPNVKLSISLGKPASPNLYANVKPI
ncbi:uncharacterized protein mRpS34 [Chelonus insularis]|uniref:uncharacterized protein mRpS34 n=1 Tax=Chelonus insularis TaxID=460826 RepID=UPI00158CBC6A|nr:uncharacterized protein LOC118063856 [Chelonus insularis]